MKTDPLKPTKQLFDLALKMFKQLWGYRLEYQKNRSTAAQSELKKLEKKIEQLLDRIVEADSTAVINAYEKRIGELQLEKQIMHKKTSNCGRPLKGFDESFRTAMDFLANPHDLWAKGHIQNRYADMKLTFADRLACVCREDFRPPGTTLPFKSRP